MEQIFAKDIRLFPDWSYNYRKLSRYIKSANVQCQQDMKFVGFIHKMSSIKIKCTKRGIKTRKLSKVHFSILGLTKNSFMNLRFLFPMIIDLS